MNETPIKLDEKERTYHYFGGETLSFQNVTELIVRDSGSHRLKTADDNIHIVLPGFIAITIGEKEWTI